MHQDEQFLPKNEHIGVFSLAFKCLFWLFGSTILLWGIFGFGIPVAFALISGKTINLPAYHAYIRRVVQRDQEVLNRYGWRPEGSLYLGSRALTIHLTGAVPEVSESGPPARSTRAEESADQTIDGRPRMVDRDAKARSWIERKGEAFSKFIYKQIVPTNACLLTLAIMVGHLWAPLVLLTVPLVIGAFFAGEYSARCRFEDSFQPSSVLTKAWLKQVRFAVCTLTALPALFTPWPEIILFLLVPVILYLIYAVYKMRTESIEIS